MHSHVFAPLLTIAKISKQLVSISRGMDKEDLRYTHTHIHTLMHTQNRRVSSHEKEGNLATCDNMGFEGITLSEVSQIEKKNTVWYHFICELLKKKKKKEPNS